MKETDKQDEKLIGELESIYQRVSEEAISSADDPVPAVSVGSRQVPDKKRGDSAAAGKPGKARARIFRFLIPAAVFAAVLILWFVWPTPYNYRSIKDGSRIYLVKENRITGSMKYFHAGRWMDRPLPSSIETVPAAPEIREEPAARRTVEEPVAAAGGKIPPVKEEDVRRDGPYFVQLKAFRERKELDSFLAANGAGIPALHWKRVEIPGKGTWYRIFSGSFTSADEAAAYLRSKELDRKFPGAFVQKQ